MGTPESCHKHLNGHCKVVINCETTLTKNRTALLWEDWLTNNCYSSSILVRHHQSQFHVQSMFKSHFSQHQTFYMISVQ